KWEAFRSWLASADHKKVVFDLKKIKILLKRCSLLIRGIIFDLHLADYLLDPTESKRALSDLVFRYLPKLALPSDDLVYGKGAKRQLLKGEKLAEYLARKTSAIFQLFPLIQDKLNT